MAWPADPLPITVELLIDGSWTDITSYVRGDSGVQIARGVTGSDNSLDPSSCTLTLDNRDGRFSPRNPEGAYHGHIGRNTQLRVTVTHNATDYRRFWGEVAEWPVDWHPSGNDVWAAIRADGPLRRLGQSTGEADSLLTKAVPTILADELLAYWPIEDLPGATSIASRGPRARPMRKEGTGFLADDDTFKASKPLPRITNGEYRGMVPNQSETDVIEVLALVYVPEDPNEGSTPRESIVQLHVTGDDIKRASLYFRDDIGSAGGFGVECHDEDDNQLDDTGTQTFTVGDVVGTPMLVGMTLTEHSGHVDVYIDVVNCETGEVDYIVDEFSGQSDVGRVWKVNTNNNGGLGDTVLGHVMVLNDYVDPTLGSGNGEELRQAATAFVGETAVNRISRLADENDLVFTFRSEAEIDSAYMGAQLPTDVVTLLRECVDADMGLLYERRDSLGFRYIERAAFYNQASDLTLDYDSQVFVVPPVPVDDDALLTNEVEVSRQDGSSFLATRDEGPLESSQVGAYRTSQQLNLRDDGQIPPSAGWLLNIGTVDRPRYPNLVVATERSQVYGDTTLHDDILNVDVGSQVTLTDLPAWMPPDDVRLIVFGVTEELSNFSHRISFNCRPADGYDVAEYDASGHLYDAHDGVVLAEDLTTSETGVDIDCGDGPFFSTADEPYDLDINGERITVTSMGAESAGVQTATVTRSVNGVSRTHATGDRVRLWQPRRWAS